MRSITLCSLLRFSPLLGLILAGTGGIAQAQVTTGSFRCTVINRSTEKPVPNARVTLTSSALFQPKVLTTDQHGEVRAVLLPPGNYDARIEHGGYRGAGIEQMRIGVGANMAQTVSLALLPGVDPKDADKLPLGGSVSIAAAAQMDGGVDFQE